MSSGVNLEYPKNLHANKNNKQKIIQPVFQHPPYKNADNISKTDVRYEAPKTPTNEYDVEMYKLKMQQYQNERGFRIAEYVGVATLLAGMLGLVTYMALKSFK